ncbi:TPA: hypothetical protein OOF36_003492 [Morganella morganii]|nr:hypothetical protein [Escherichia coli]HCR4019202.1 hypothetical protein [Morganella morganii]
MKAKTHFSGGLLICSAVMSFQVGAVTSSSADVQITVTSPRTTCNLTVQSTLGLGTLSPGEQTHSAFPVHIDCTGRIRTALIARNTTGTLQADNYRVAIPIGSITNSQGPFLWLKNDVGGSIELTGEENSKFCDMTAQNKVCQVTPITDVRNSSSYGEGEVSIRFSIIYPA